MNVILLSPGFPAEMPLFTRGLAEVGASVLGVGDQPEAALPAEAREHLSAYLQVRGLLQEDSTIEAIMERVEGQTIDRVECLWEPGMILAARLREAMGLPGMTVEQTIPFRDKDAMKAALDEHGIRTPRHARGRTEDEVRSAAEVIGYPLIIKPIAGAGSKDTHRVADDSELDLVLQKVKHVPEVSVEEYIEGEEYTYDTVCAGGEIAFENIAWYRPKPLVMAQNPWISPQSICLADLTTPEIDVGRQLGRSVIKALGFEAGFTHMEWFRTPSGEAVFGEIGARPAGARLVHAMNFAYDTDLFIGWAEAVCHGRFSQPSAPLYNSGIIFKRSEGDGRIQHIEGLEGLMARYGEHIVQIDLTPIGAPRRDPRTVIVGDGWVVVRHRDLDLTLEMSDRVGTDLRMFAS